MAPSNVTLIQRRTDKVPQRLRAHSISSRHYGPRRTRRSSRAHFVERPALVVADIFRDFGPAWLDADRGHVGHAQLKVMSAIEASRTAALGGYVVRCENGTCTHTVIAYCRCRDRHFPKYQGSQALTWMQERKAELLQVPYFHIAFTLPAEIGAIAYRNKAVRAPALPCPMVTLPTLTCVEVSKVAVWALAGVANAAMMHGRVIINARQVRKVALVVMISTFRVELMRRFQSNIGSSDLKGPAQVRSLLHSRGAAAHRFS